MYLNLVRQMLWLQVTFMDHAWCFLWISLQRSIYSNAAKVPSEVESIMDQETFDKARVYQLDKTNFGLIHGFYSQIETTVSLTLL